MAYTRLGNFRLLTAASSLCLVLAAGLPCSAEESVVAQGKPEVESLLGRQEQAPPTPTGLSALNQGSRTGDHIVLRWHTTKDSTAIEYLIYRLENQDPKNTLKLLVTLPRRPYETNGVYTDLAVKSLYTYTYFMTARDAFGNQSANSNLSTVRAPLIKTPPTPPSSSTPTQPHP